MYNKKIKIFNKTYQIKYKSIAYYLIEYIKPVATVVLFTLISWLLYITMYFIMLPYSTLA